MRCTDKLEDRLRPAAGDDWRTEERALILSYAPRGGRDALAAIMALDDRLAAVMRAMREPLVGQMKLTWWHGALLALDEGAPAAEPVLMELAVHVLPRGITGAMLARMIDGWDELLAPGALGEEALLRYANARGGGVFGAAARVIGAHDDVAAAGQGWALADLVAHSREPGLAAALARPLLARAAARRWSREGRPLGAMAHLARRPGASPLARTGRALWHRMTGR